MFGVVFSSLGIRMADLRTARSIRSGSTTKNRRLQTFSRSLKRSLNRPSPTEMPSFGSCEVMPDPLTRTLLSTLRHSGYRVADPEQVGDDWIVRAVGQDGQVYSAKGDDPYEAAVALAELVGFDLRDG